MAIVDSIKGLLHRKGSLKNITALELRRERMALEQEESRISSDVEKLEREKQQLFLRGKDEASERQRRILATKIKQRDSEAASADKRLRFVSRQLRVINGLIQIKENERLFERLGLSSLINRLDPDQLERYIIEASVEGGLQMETFQRLLTTVEESERITGVGEEERDVEEIMKAMQEAQVAEREHPEQVEEFARQRLDQILHPPEEEPA